MTNLELVQQCIEKYDLLEKSRHPYALYKRYYLYFILKADGMKLSAIGRVFGKTHATVYNGINKHKAYMTYGDKLYIKHISDLLGKFNIGEEVKPLKDMVMQCSSMEELEVLQSMVANHYM